MDDQFDEFKKYQNLRRSTPLHLARKSQDFQNEMDFRIFWRNYPDERVFYQLDFFDSAVIRFVNCGKFVFEKQLNNEESATMLFDVKNLENVNIQPRMFYTHQNRNQDCIEAPELPYSLLLSTWNIDVCWRWTSNNKPCTAAQFIHIEKLTNAIERKIPNEIKNTNLPSLMWL